MTNLMTINCGSSTLKFELYQAGVTEKTRLFWGLVDRIGAGGSVECHSAGGKRFTEGVAVPDHGDAARRVLAWLRLAGAPEIAAVAHRVVHGGERFTGPARIDDAVLAEIDALTELAPLHNAPALAAMRTLRNELGATVPMVAVFDTTFHRTLPPHAGQYAIPHELTERLAIRRYGFHGIAHRSMVEQYATMTNGSLDQTRLITLQLGNGCSAAAIRGGQCIDTSMGFTPLEGLVMGTRSGDVDPSLAGWIAKKEDVDVAQVDDWLNRRSGLLGVSGTSRDMRDLLQRESTERRAALAVQMFCYRVKKYIGSYLAVLGGADAMIFGGGIGENSPVIRERICEGMAWCGLQLDADKNGSLHGAGEISAGESRVRVHVIRVDESAILVQDTLRCLG
jgi:acetate kinase